MQEYVALQHGGTVDRKAQMEYVHSKIKLEGVEPGRPIVRTSTALDPTYKYVFGAEGVLRLVIAPTAPAPATNAVNPSARTRKVVDEGSH